MKAETKIGTRMHVVHILRLAAGVGAALAALAVTAGPASAAPHHLVEQGRVTAVPTSAVRAATVAPLNVTNVAVYDATTGVTTSVSQTGPVTSTVGCTQLNQTLCFQAPGGVAFSLSGGLQAGGVYATPNQIMGVTFHGYSCGSGFNQGQDSMGAQVDQFTSTPSTNTLDSLGVQFSCSDPNFVVWGTVAYNLLPTTPHQGYYVFDQYGGLYGFGNDSYDAYLGDLTQQGLNAPIVGMALTPSANGYWMVGSDGGVFSFGDAGFHGSMGGSHLNAPIVAMAATPDGNGYWFVASDGGVFSFGDAAYYGSKGGMHLNEPIVGMAATPSGHGYWLVASDGGIFTFGDATFQGSTGAVHLNKPIVGMTAKPDGTGYWLVASDGGIFAFNAAFVGSHGGAPLNQPIVGMAASADGGGYWLVASDGGIFTYGDAGFSGSLGGLGATNVGGLTR